jgi:hypothetical protein
VVPADEHVHPSVNHGHHFPSTRRVNWRHGWVSQKGRQKIRRAPPAGLRACSKSGLVRRALDARRSPLAPAVASPDFPRGSRCGTQSKFRWIGFNGVLFVCRTRLGLLL